MRTKPSLINRRGQGGSGVQVCLHGVCKGSESNCSTKITNNNQAAHTASQTQELSRKLYKRGRRAYPFTSELSRLLEMENEDLDSRDESQTWRA